MALRSIERPRAGPSGLSPISFSPFRISLFSGNELVFERLAGRFCSTRLTMQEPIPKCLGRDETQIREVCCDRCHSENCIDGGKSSYERRIDAESAPLRDTSGQTRRCSQAAGALGTCRTGKACASTGWIGAYPRVDGSSQSL